MFKDLKVPMPDDIIPLRDVYEILMKVHGADNDASSELPDPVYKFSEQALEIFRQQHDEYIRRKQAIPDDEQRRGVLSKAVGQLARISGVLFGLEQAFQVAESGEEDFNTNWEFEIDEEACKKGVTIMDYLIEQKFLLMPPEVVLYGSGGENLTENEKFIAEESDKIKKTLEWEGVKGSMGSISASAAVQHRLFTPPKKNGKGENTAANAVPYFEKLSQISFGKVEKVKKSGRPVTVFRKRKWDELEPDQHETVRKLKVEEAKYKVIFEEK